MTETQEARLYHPASTRQRKGSFESGGSGDDWTHVSAPEGSTDSKGEPTKILSHGDFFQQINSPLGRDVILKEIITLKGFFLSQSHLQDRKGNCKIDVGYAPPDVASVSSALSSIQAILDGFVSEEFLNMLSLENNDAYLKRYVVSCFRTICFPTYISSHPCLLYAVNEEFVMRLFSIIIKRHCLAVWQIGRFKRKQIQKRNCLK